MTHSKNIVVVCGDPGGSNAVTPVLKVLREDGRLTVFLYAYREAKEIWTKAGLEFEELDEELTIEDAQEILENRETRLLFTSTSINEFCLEKLFVAAARRLSIPSLAILDFWSNYVRRFDDGAGRLEYLPNRIAVMDERAREEMIAAGFDPDQLVITGNPAFDDLPSRLLEFSNDRRDSMRSALGAGLDNLFVVFVSQPLSTFYGPVSIDPRSPGYDESSVLKQLIEALRTISENAEQKVVLAIIPHPREGSKRLPLVQTPPVEVKWYEGSDRHSLLMAADLVTGMSSSLLIDACYLGCVTISLQPGLRGPDVLPTNRLGFSQAVYEVAEIEPVVSKLLLNEAAKNKIRRRLQEMAPPGGAARRVVDLAHEVMETTRSESQRNAS